MRGQQKHAPVLGRGMHAPVPPRKKIAWEGDRHTSNRRTLRLLDRIGPVGRFDENYISDTDREVPLFQCVNKWCLFKSLKFYQEMPNVYMPLRIASLWGGGCLQSRTLPGNCLNRPWCLLHRYWFPILTFSGRIFRPENPAAYVVPQF